MTQNIACPSTAGTVNIRTSSLPFSDIPHQSLLFRQYQTDPLSLKKYYPSVVSSPMEVKTRISDVLEGYATDRDQLCDALDVINQGAGSGPATMDNIAALRSPGTVAVVTGQQAGLFTGPLYTIYKALSAVRMAECLSAAGHKAVPVFWIATEDHDFDEVASTTVRASGGEERKLTYTAAGRIKGASVGEIRLDGTINALVDELMDAMAASEFSSEIRSELLEAYANGVLFGDAFARLLAAILPDQGLIIMDPRHPQIKRLAAPIYSEAIANSAAIVDAITTRSEELKHDGYHAQVLVEEDYFPLFWHTDTGERTAVRNSGEGVYRAKADRREFTLAELAALAESEPGRFSPGVMLRPVVQDYLLPTICYFGGGAEIAYFAQNSEVYRILERPVTPILHRQSFTVVEAKHARTLDKFGLDLLDLFTGRDEVRRKVVAERVSPETATLFSEVADNISAQLARLDSELANTDKTLQKNLETRRRKIIYHIEALRQKAYKARLARDATAARQIDAMFDSLLPGGELQERSVNIVTFLNSYGPYFTRWIYAAIDLDDTGHRVLYL